MRLARVIGRRRVIVTLSCRGWHGQNDFGNRGDWIFLWMAAARLSSRV